MDRTIKAGAALCAAGMWMAIHAMAQADLARVDPAVSAAGEAPAVSAPGNFEQELCDAVAEGTRLLIENRLIPANDEAKAALLEALIRSSEPSVVFLSEEELAARSQRLSDREWDAGLTLVSVADGLPKVAAVRMDSPAARM